MSSLLKYTCSTTDSPRTVYQTKPHTLSGMNTHIHFDTAFFTRMLSINCTPVGEKDTPLSLSHPRALKGKCGTIVRMWTQSALSSIVCLSVTMWWNPWCCDVLTPNLYGWSPVSCSGTSEKHQQHHCETYIVNNTQGSSDCYLWHRVGANQRHLSGCLFPSQHTRACIWGSQVKKKIW